MYASYIVDDMAGWLASVGFLDAQNKDATYLVQVARKRERMARFQAGESS